MISIHKTPWIVICACKWIFYKQNDGESELHMEKKEEIKPAGPGEITSSACGEW